MNLSQQLPETKLSNTELISQHSKSFYFATALLPEKQRDAVRCLYAFCRTTDDLIDNNPNASFDTIEAWRSDLNSTFPQNVLLKDFKKVLNEFQIPIKYANELIDGCKRDLTQKRYADFADLASYCYQVAATVGLMSAYIIGFDRAHHDKMEEYAIKAGLALQLTNVLRDVREDWERGRLYLPLKDFEYFNCSPDDFSRWTEAVEFKQLIHFEIERCKGLYKEAFKGIKYLHFAGRLAVSAALTVYAEILKEIEKQNFDVFSKRAFVPFSRKLSLLPLIIWRALFS